MILITIYVISYIKFLVLQWTLKAKTCTCSNPTACIVNLHNHCKLNAGWGRNAEN